MASEPGLLIRYLGLLIVAAFIVGCAGSPMRTWSMDPDQLDQLGAAELCNAYAVSKQSNEPVRAALKRRDALLIELITEGQPDPVTGDPPRSPFTVQEWEAIEERTVFIGMSEHALICSWGLPNAFGGGAINETVGPWGSKRQYVYRRGTYTKTQYVYVQNGTVTGWQQ